MTARVFPSLFSACAACAAAALVVTACGDDLVTDAPVADAAVEQPPVDAPAVVVDAAQDVVVDASIAETGFCANAPSFIACEDFERGLPPSRGWGANGTGGLTITDDAGGPDGGRAGAIVIPSFNSGFPIARLERDFVSTASTYHLELVARVEREAGGDVTLAYLLMRGADGGTPSSNVLARQADTLVRICSNGVCGADQSVPETFAAWTPVTIEIDAAGTITVNIAGQATTRGNLGGLAPSNGSASAGGHSIGQGEARVIVFDDALISSK